MHVEHNGSRLRVYEELQRSLYLVPVLLQNARMKSESPPTTVAEPKPSRPPRPWLAWVIVFSGIVMAFLYWYQTRLPDHVVIAGGPADGRYDQLAKALAEELEHRLGIIVTVKQTHGSLDNLHQLESREVSLALYQSDTRTILKEASSKETTRFVANLYPEYLVPFVRVEDPVDLRQLQDSVVSCNDEMSGDHAMLTLLMNHLGSTGDPSYIPYVDVPSAFQNGDVDLAVISCGLEAPVLEHVLQDGEVRLAEIPFLDSMIRRNPALSPGTIPAGYFSSTPHVVPPDDFQTVKIHAQLLASRKTSVRLVEAVTRIVLDPQFQRRLRLAELAAGGQEYAESHPEFPIHIGASHIYAPELRPLLNPDFVEGTEGIRSFLVSIIAAIWLAHRWWKRRELLSQEHRLDRYIRDLLQIERDQIGIDGENASDADVLQDLLDQVTHLRQAALAEFTAHELNEDQAVDCFVEMSHALSDKISGKLTRHALKQLQQAQLESATSDGRDIPS